MVAIVTEKFRLHNAAQFKESFSEASASTYYMLIGKPTAFDSDTSGGTDTSPPTPNDDVSSEFHVWDSAIGAKKISSGDVSNVVPRRNWTNGTIYDMYEHDISSTNTSQSGASNLYDATFFFMSSTNKVYKVLDNNGGTAYSGTEPTSTSNSPFKLGGYILKYMYTVSASDEAKFFTSDFIPAITDSTVSANATDGAIESIIVTAGTGQTDGTYFTPVYGDGANAGKTTGAILKLVISNGAIASFGLTDGTDTTIHSAGTEYTFATVNLASGYTFSDAALTTAAAIGGSGGAVKVIISPKGGHGFNAINELGGHFVMARVTMTGAENDDISAGNDFRNLALCIDPTTFGTSTIASDSTTRLSYAVKLESGAGTFLPDETVIQQSTGAVGKVVEYDASNRILFLIQERYNGHGASSVTSPTVSTGVGEGNGARFSGANIVSNSGGSGASGTPDAAADSAVTLSNGGSITFTDGYANPELEPDSGNIVYVENRRPIFRSSSQTEDIKLVVEF